MHPSIVKMSLNAYKRHEPSPKNQRQGDPIILCEAEDLVRSLRPQSRTPALVVNWSVMASMVFFVSLSFQSPNFIPWFLVFRLCQERHNKGLLPLRSRCQILIKGRYLMYLQCSSPNVRL